MIKLRKLILYKPFEVDISELPLPALSKNSRSRSCSTPSENSEVYEISATDKNNNIISESSQQDALAKLFQNALNEKKLKPQLSGRTLLINIFKNQSPLSWSYGVMAITLDFESNNPSSSLGRTSPFEIFFYEIHFCTFSYEKNNQKRFLEVLPRLELGLLDSKSKVIAITP